MRFSGGGNLRPNQEEGYCLGLSRNNLLRKRLALLLKYKQRETLTVAIGGTKGQFYTLLIIL